jgi:hypothetical protein
MGLFSKKGVSHEGKSLAKWIQKLIDAGTGPEAKRVEGIIANQLAKQDSVAVVSRLNDIIGDNVYTPRMRRRAAHTLGLAISHGNVESNSGLSALGNLAAALKDADAEFCKDLLFTIDQLGSDALSTMPIVVGTMKRIPDESVQATACRILGHFGDGSRAAVPLIANVLRDASDWEARSIAAEALGKIGPAAADAVPTLKNALKDESGDVCMNAKEALSRITSA